MCNACRAVKRQKRATKLTVDGENIKSLQSENLNLKYKIAETERRVKNSNQEAAQLFKLLQTFTDGLPAIQSSPKPEHHNMMPDSPPRTSNRAPPHRRIGTRIHSAGGRVTCGDRAGLGGAYGSDGTLPTENALSDCFVPSASHGHQAVADDQDGTEGLQMKNDVVMRGSASPEQRVTLSGSSNPKKRKRELLPSGWRVKHSQTHDRAYYVSPEGERRWDKPVLRMNDNERAIDSLRRVPDEPAKIVLPTRTDKEHPTGGNAVVLAVGQAALDIEAAMALKASERCRDFKGCCEMRKRDLSVRATSTAAVQTKTTTLTAAMKHVAAKATELAQAITTRQQAEADLQTATAAAAKETVATDAAAVVPVVLLPTSAARTEALSSNVVLAKALPTDPVLKRTTRSGTMYTDAVLAEERSISDAVFTDEFNAFFDVCVH